MAERERGEGRGEGESLPLAVAPHSLYAQSSCGRSDLALKCNTCHIYCTKWPAPVLTVNVESDQVSHDDHMMVT